MLLVLLTFYAFHKNVTWQILSDTYLTLFVKYFINNKLFGFCPLGLEYSSFSRAKQMWIIHKGFGSGNVSGNSRTESLCILYDLLMEHKSHSDESTKAEVIERLILFAVKLREYFKDMRDDYYCIHHNFVTSIF